MHVQLTTIGNLDGSQREGKRRGRAGDFHGPLQDETRAVPVGHVNWEGSQFVVPKPNMLKPLWHDPVSQ